MVIQQPKTRRSERTIALDGGVVVILRKHRAKSAKHCLEIGTPMPLWVFTNEKGKPLSASTAHHALRRLCERLTIPNIGHHALRHLHATLLLAQGLPIPAVSARLGHANPNITMAVYAHAMPAQDEEAARLIEQALKSHG